jgi:protein disulfide-isomerase-like protein
VIVGTTFEELVMNSNADVLIEFDTPWCGRCKTFAPVYEALADNLFNNKNIVLGKVDTTANDIEGVDIQRIPTLKLYLNGKKDSPVDFNDEMTELNIINFLMQHTTYFLLKIVFTFIIIFLIIGFVLTLFIISFL